MSDYYRCPLEIFNMYIEVGDVKEAKIKSEECTYIEVWISPIFSNNCVRTECKHPMRRPIYSVLKQIQKLCINKPACVIIMCDDMGGDTITWGISISLLLQQLEKENILVHSMLFTKSDEKNAINFAHTAKHWSNKEKETFLLLFDMLDAVVYGQSNYYSRKEKIQIKTKACELPLLLRDFIQAAQKDI